MWLAGCMRSHPRTSSAGNFGTWPAVLHRVFSVSNVVTAVTQSFSARSAFAVSEILIPSGLTTPMAVIATRRGVDLLFVVGTAGDTRTVCVWRRFAQPMAAAL